jgi:hypothetical protein
MTGVDKISLSVRNDKSGFPNQACLPVGGYDNILVKSIAIDLLQAV